jgi:general nucleoside transport system permease protein
MSLRLLRSPVLLAILGATLVGGIIIALSGHNPFLAYFSILLGAFAGPNLASTLNRAIPIVGMGLCAAIAFRAGLFNLGGEGQLVIGGMVAALVGLYAPLPGVLLLPAASIAAMLAGGLYGLVPAVLQFRFGVPLLISSLLLNYPAREFASYLVNHPFRDEASGLSQTFQVPEAARLPALGAGSGLHGGLVLIAIVAIVTWVVNTRTTAGYDTRMAGLNPRFAAYGGVSLARMGSAVMFASGACAGLVGAIQVLAVHYRFIDGSLVGPLYAYTGLLAALLADSGVVGVVLAGTFFSAVQTGGLGMERATDVPRELTLVLQAVVILFLATRTRLSFDGARETAGQT